MNKRIHYTGYEDMMAHPNRIRYEERHEEIQDFDGRQVRRDYAPTVDKFYLTPQACQLYLSFEEGEDETKR